jgi:hypothetical protein
MNRYGYDIVGDIHGHARPLEDLLQKMGYECRDGIFRHESRIAVFVGDLVDRGPAQRETVGIVRRMCDAGSAMIVMGNHEFNAIAYATPDETNGGYLRPHTPKNRGQHEAFLEAYGDDPTAYRDVIDWFKTMPLWLDLDGIRVIHACWDRAWIDRIKNEFPAAPFVPPDMLDRAASKGTWEYEALETLLKGREVALPVGHVYHDKEGNPRDAIRVRWWDETAETFREAYMGPESHRDQVPHHDIGGAHLVDYAAGEPPVVLGHYWLEGVPEPLSSNIGCVDYSIAKPGGRLVAYRWRGETKLLSENFVWFDPN